MIAKRLLDICLSFFGLVVLAPVLIGLAGLIRVQMGAPVFFTQMRPGLKGMPFRMVKLRTMREVSDSRGEPLPDEDRLTGFGKWLRATSLDELPELWNVLKGDMSLVGPRPLLMEYLPLYTPEQARRHEVRPGITGWAQVNGRNTLGWDEKFELDRWYVDNRSLALDIRILALTVWNVLCRQGINSAGHATMPPFTRRPEQRPAADESGAVLDYQVSDADK